MRVVAAAWVRDGALLAACRGPGRDAGGWELPGGKVEPGETDQAALARELLEELCVAVVIGDHVATVQTPSLTLAAYLVTSAGHPLPREHRELRWLTFAQRFDVAWLAADVPLVHAVADRLR